MKSDACPCGETSTNESSSGSQGHASMPITDKKPTPLGPPTISIPERSEHKSTVPDDLTAPILPIQDDPSSKEAQSSSRQPSSSRRATSTTSSRDRGNSRSPRPHAAPPQLALPAIPASQGSPDSIASIPYNDEGRPAESCGDVATKCHSGSNNTLQRNTDLERWQQLALQNEQQLLQARQQISGQQDALQRFNEVVSREAFRSKCDWIAVGHTS